MKLTITTNGTTIHQYHDLINKIKANIHSMVISLDAGTANTYQTIRNSNFDQVIDNCEWLRLNDIVTHGQFVLKLIDQLKFLSEQNVQMCGGIKHLISKHHSLV